MMVGYRDALRNPEGQRWAPACGSQGRWRALEIGDIAAVDGEPADRGRRSRRATGHPV